jgi:hypothetical protein
MSEETVLILACATILDELQLAIAQTGTRFPVVLVESGLHLYPDKLKSSLQEELDRIANVNRVLLAFGYCGNCVVGIKPPSFTLTLPRAADCISLLLGSSQRRAEVQGEAQTYFLTQGWFEHERNIYREYEDAVARFGKERADRIFKTMLAHYKRLAVIDTGAYPLDSILKKTTSIADSFGLEHIVLPGDLSFLRALLTGPWDERFINVSPGQTITLETVLVDGADPNAFIQDMALGMDSQ